MTPPSETILAKIKEMREIESKSTKVSAWYAHNEDNTVRGPYCRWLKVSEVGEQYKHNVAHASDDAIFFAMAANNFNAILSAMEVLVSGLESVTKINPPSRSTSGPEWADVCLKDNCEKAQEALRKAAEILNNKGEK